MTQVFKRRSNAVASLLLICLAGGAAGIFAFFTVEKWSIWQTEVGKPLNQPVPFSHRHHVSGLGIDCRYCHTSVMRSAYAGMPPVHTCMTCHSQIWQNSPLLETVRKSFAEGKPLEWNRVYRIPKYVYFNHSIHVNKGIGCTSCHQEIEDMPLTWKSRPFYMKDCVACHRAPEKVIRPKQEVLNVYWTPPPNQKVIGSELARRYHIPGRRLTDCYTCHR